MEVILPPAAASGALDVENIELADHIAENHGAFTWHGWNQVVSAQHLLHHERM